MLGELFIHEIPTTAVVGTYNLWLVALSFFIATAAAFISVNLVASYRGSAMFSKRKTSLMGGLFLGGGIWSMHFTGMLAYEMDMVHSYSVPLTAASLFFAALFSFFAFEQILKPKLSKRHILLSGMIVGMAVVVMHYLGMAAMEMQASLRYIPSLFAASVMIALGAAIAAIVILRQFLARYRPSYALLAAMVMGVAVCGMHYTGMQAAVFLPYADCRFDTNQKQTGLILLVGMGSFFLVILPGFFISLRRLMHASRSNDAKEKAPRWQYVYFALAGFDIITVAISLLLNHSIMTIYHASSHTNMLWGERQSEIMVLSRYATSASAPGNDVFDSRDIDGEKTKLASLEKQFHAGYHIAVKNIAALSIEHFPNNGASYKQQLLSKLQLSAEAFKLLSHQATIIFAELQQGREANAATHMALMDRHFSDTSNHLADAMHLIADIQKNLSSDQLEQAKALRAIEYMIAAFALIMIFGATLYGQRIAHIIKNDEDKKRLQNDMLDMISSIQSVYIASKGNGKNLDKKHIFDHMLTNILALEHFRFS